jgi:hypothetical protein
MGDGNFGGGGSVKWLINNRDDNGQGRPGTHSGKDKGPQTEIGAKLRVTCKNARVVSGASGTVVVEVTLADDEKQIVLEWGDAANPSSATQQS